MAKKASLRAAAPAPEAKPALPVPSGSAGGGPLRVLVACHNHPALSNGGAEIAAYQQFRSLAARPDCTAWFLGCDRNASAEKPGAVLTQPFGPDEYLYATAAFDWFNYGNPDANFRAELESLIIRLAPDVVHVHHYAHFGVEVMAHIKRAAPQCKIVLTLHEFGVICHHHGQMVTRAHFNLCYEASPAACHACFPEYSKSDFFLRKLYIMRYLDLVDGFTSPSRFLAERYIAWGLPARKMTVVENLMPRPAATPAPDAALEGTLRVGFFGQISKLKGIDVLLDAAAMLETDKDADISFDIFGDYTRQPPEFQQAFLARLGRIGANVVFHGPYDRQRVDRLMQSVNAVLMPSIWWENSPVVIQEALRNRRPVICSDIGGMAEKVRDGVDGLHFPAGSAYALASLLRRLAADRSILAKLNAGLTGEAAVIATIDEYISIYRQLLDPLADVFAPAAAETAEWW
jgi:glycosyltransferase involved in cell wall biosynthesis